MLDADELHRLIALRAASADNVTVYAAVLSALVAAKVAYRLQVRTDDLVGDLAGGGIDRSRVDDALRQLQAARSGPSSDLIGSVAATPWDPALRESMITHRRAVHEEAIIDVLLADLA